MFFSSIASLFGIQQEKRYDVAILGSGTGGLTSALYATRGGQSAVVVEGSTPGGLLTQSNSVQNWPGEMDVIGGALMDKMRAQVQANGAHFVQEEVVGVDFSRRPFTVTTRSLDGEAKVRKILADSCVIAMGTTPNRLKVPGESEYWGKGVSNCAICDGSLYKGKVVGVVGGGDAAVVEALYLSNLAKQVHLFVRADRLRAVEMKRSAALLQKPNVQVHYRTSVAEVKGDGKKITGAVLQSQGKTPPKEAPLDGLFLAIGSTPNSQLFQGILEIDQQGYIVLKNHQETSVRGVYGVGDIVTVKPEFKQAICAASDGAKAALQAQEFVTELRFNPRVASVQRIASEVSRTPVVVEIGSVSQFEQEMKMVEGTVVVDFYATWCGPCKQIAPLIEKSARHLSGRVKFLKVNVDQVRELGQIYDIHAMPTALLMDASGKVLDRKVGSGQIADLLKQLETDEAATLPGIGV